MIIHLFILFFAKIDSVFVRLYNLMIRGNFKQMDGLICHPHQILGEKYISIGKGSRIERNVILTAWDRHGDEKFSPLINIGKNCNINEFNQISACGRIVIGNNLLTGRYVYISDNSDGSSIYEEQLVHPHKRAL